MSDIGWRNLKSLHHLLRWKSGASRLHGAHHLGTEPQSVFWCERSQGYVVEECLELYFIVSQSILLVFFLNKCIGIRDWSLWAPAKKCEINPIWHPKVMHTILLQGQSLKLWHSIGSLNKVTSVCSRGLNCSYCISFHCRLIMLQVIDATGWPHVRFPSGGFMHGLQEI